MATKKTEEITKNAVPAKSRYEGITKFAYVGPALPGGRLKCNAVLSGTYGEITGYLKETLEAYPEAEKLIVPVGQLAKAREKAGTPGNIINK